MANLTMKVLQEQINELRNKVAILEATNKVRKIPVGLEIGDTFEIAGINWKILDITDKGYMCLADKLEDSMEFDEGSSDWEGSQLRKYLNTEFFEKIADEIGEENIITFNRDLTSLDGQTEYGECEDMVSLLTIDEYRKYRKLIPNTNFYWWLISPWSTPCNGWNRSVAVVAPAGLILDRYCLSSRGVRPVCIFSSLIFESEE
nr:MAG TPA: hypothetical protein [Caudoviricetes sp.]